MEHPAVLFKCFSILAISRISWEHGQVFVQKLVLELERSACRRWWAVCFYKYIFKFMQKQYLCQFIPDYSCISTTVFVQLHQCICASTGNEGMQQAMVGRGKATPETDQVPTRQYSFPSALFKEKTWEAWNLKVHSFYPASSAFLNKKHVRL